jgi:KaiC/GvpD/RAD55 family RecA-like ATPase
MNREQIEQAAEAYIRKQDFASLKEDDAIFGAFIAGAEARQPEIDALTTDCGKYQRDIADGQTRENIAQGIIKEKRDKIDELRRHKLNLRKMLDEAKELLVKHGIKQPAIQVNHQHNA